LSTAATFSIRDAYESLRVRDHVNQSSRKPYKTATPPTSAVAGDGRAIQIRAPFRIAHSA
jgi:hypothetical protein